MIPCKLLNNKSNSQKIQMSEDSAEVLFWLRNIYVYKAYINLNCAKYESMRRPISMALARVSC